MGAASGKPERSEGTTNSGARVSSQPTTRVTNGCKGPAIHRRWTVTRSSSSTATRYPTKCGAGGAQAIGVKGRNIGDRPHGGGDDCRQGCGRCAGEVNGARWGANAPKRADRSARIDDVLRDARASGPTTSLTRAIRSRYVPWARSAKLRGLDLSEGRRQGRPELSYRASFTSFRFQVHPGGQKGPHRLMDGAVKGGGKRGQGVPPSRAPARLRPLRSLFLASPPTLSPNRERARAGSIARSGSAARWPPSPPRPPKPPPRQRRPRAARSSLARCPLGPNLGNARARRITRAHETGGHPTLQAVPPANSGRNRGRDAAMQAPPQVGTETGDRAGARARERRKKQNVRRKWARAT